MNPELHDRLVAALERPHRLGMIGGDLEEQLAHCASFSRVLAHVPAAAGALACDLGTGGGLPGVALAASYPSLTWLLVEIRTARATEVERAVARLSLSAEVSTVAAQELGHRPELREQATLVVARSFGPPALTAECAAGLLQRHGHLVVSEPPEHGRSNEDRWPTLSLRDFGLEVIDQVSEAGHRFAVIRKVGTLDTSLPRLPPRASRGWRV